MAEILNKSQSPVYHQVFWNGDVVVPDTTPIAKLYSVSEDLSEYPTQVVTSLLTTLTSEADENNPGLYKVNIPYIYTNVPAELRLQWEYNIGSTLVVKLDEVFVIQPYVDFNHVISDLGISTDSSDPSYKSYKDLLVAEKYARKQIENYTGQKFYLYDDVKVVYGYESDILPLSDRITSIYKLYENDILLIDTINNIDNLSFDIQVTESKYGIRVNRNNILDNTVYTANGMIPPTIHDSYGVFKSNVPYKIYAKFGWEKVPDDVELAAVELMKDYFSKDLIWRNKYIKNISTFDWDFEYSSEVYGGTGNSYVDKLLEDYIVDRVEIL